MRSGYFETDLYSFHISGTQVTGNHSSHVTTNIFYILREFHWGFLHLFIILSICPCVFREMATVVTCVSSPPLIQILWIGSEKYIAWNAPRRRCVFWCPPPLNFAKIHVRGARGLQQIAPKDMIPLPAQHLPGRTGQRGFNFWCGLFQDANLQP